MMKCVYDMISDVKPLSSPESFRVTREMDSEYFVGLPYRKYGVCGPTSSPIYGQSVADVIISRRAVA